MDARYPPSSALSPFLKQRFLHEQFISTLRRVYLPHEGHLLQLDRFAAAPTRLPFVVYGARGSGKSALLANWVDRYQVVPPLLLLLLLRCWLLLRVGC